MATAVETGKRGGGRAADDSALAGGSDGRSWRWRRRFVVPLAAKPYPLQRESSSRGNGGGDRGAGGEVSGRRPCCCLRWWRPLGGGCRLHSAAPDGSHPKSLLSTVPTAAAPGERGGS